VRSAQPAEHVRSLVPERDPHDLRMLIVQVWCLARPLRMRPRTKHHPSNPRILLESWPDGMLLD
jgi:hypothetical protein